MPVYQLIHEIPFFPPAEEAEADGLLAVGGDLTKERLLAAYRQAFFHGMKLDSPILWWCPDPRLVCFRKSLKYPEVYAKSYASRSLKFASIHHLKM